MAFSFSKKITIDATKCGTANSTDFPMLFTGSYSFLATTANGGGVQHASGWDVYFYSDATLTTKLDHEIVSWDNRGNVIYFVRIPTLTVAQDTVIYIAYGDAAISSSASVTTTWETNHKRVYHLKDNAATTAVVDSSQSASNGTFELATTATNTNTVAHPGRGVYGQSCILMDATNGNVTMGATTPLTAATAFSISFWDYVISDSTAFPSRFGIDISGAGTHFQGFRAGTGTNAGYGNFFFAPGGTIGAPWGLQVASCPTVSSAVGAWHHICITGTDPMSTTPANYSFYYDGVLYSSANSTGAGMSDLAVNRFGHDSADNAANCLMDEWRITSGAQRSASWVLAEYNNQRSPQAFYQVGGPNEGVLNETQWK